MDDFVYLCDDAYTPKEVRDMEADVLATLQYDINIPVAYQFLRRYAKVNPLGKPVGVMRVGLPEGKVPLGKPVGVLRVV